MANKIRRRSASGTWITVIDGDDYLSSSYSSNISTLEEDVTALLLSAVPLGVAFEYYASTPPTGWAFPVGQTYARDDYPELSALIAPDASSPFWVDSTDFKMPDKRGVFPIGVADSGTFAVALGEIGGSADAVVVDHNHTQNSHNHTQNSHNHTQNAHGHTSAAHTHTTPAHTHTGTAASAGAHGHNIGAGVQFPYAGPGPGAFGTGGTWGVTGAWQNTGANGGAHTHSVTTVSGGGGTSGSTTPGGVGNTTATNIAQTATNNATTATNNAAGVSGVDKNLPPYLACYYIMRLA